MGVHLPNAEVDDPSDPVLSPYIVSDCHAIGDLAAECDCSTPGHSYRHPGHDFAPTPSAAVELALAAG